MYNLFEFLFLQLLPLLHCINIGHLISCYSIYIHAVSNHQYWVLWIEIKHLAGSLSWRQVKDHIQPCVVSCDSLLWKKREKVKRKKKRFHSQIYHLFICTLETKYDHKTDLTFLKLLWLSRFRKELAITLHQVLLHTLAKQRRSYTFTFIVQGRHDIVNTMPFSL